VADCQLGAEICYKRLVTKPNKQPLSKEDFVWPMMTDLSINSMVDNTVSVSTTAAKDAHMRRMATSRLHANTNAERRVLQDVVLKRPPRRCHRQPPGCVSRIEQSRRGDAILLRARRHARHVGGRGGSLRGGRESQGTVGLVLSLSHPRPRSRDGALLLHLEPNPQRPTSEPLQPPVLRRVPRPQLLPLRFVMVREQQLVVRRRVSPAPVESTLPS